MADAPPPPDPSAPSGPPAQSAESAGAASGAATTSDVPPRSFEPTSAVPEVAASPFAAPARPAVSSHAPDDDEALLAHLDALYGFAQLVTPDADAASRLVRDTYARAFGTPLPAGIDAASDRGRSWLYGLLLDERVVMRDNEVTLSLADDTLSARRFALSETLVEQLLPAALLALPPQLRLMLVLCDVEGLSCEEAGGVVGVGPDAGCDLLVEAQETLVANMRDKAAVHEGPILERMLEVPGSMRRALADALERELDPLPPTLRPTIPLPERRTQVVVTEGNRSRRGLYVAAALLAVLATLALAWWQRRSTVFSPDDLIATTMADAATMTVQSPLSSVEAAEAFVEDQAGWRVHLPTLRGYRIDGAAMRDVAPDVSVPVVHYVPEGGSGGSAVAVYAYTYRLLDMAKTHVALDPSVLAGLESDAHAEQVDASNATAVVWRTRDDVLIAVSRPPVVDLAARIER